MVDETLSGGGSAASICPWCSAEYTGEPAACPSCGAALTGDPTMDPSMPGLTAIDAAAIVRAKAPAPRQRNRLLSWISGEYPDDAPSASDAQALAPPDAEVQREILRLELEAEVANLEAERDSLLSEAVVEGRLDELPQDIQPMATGEFDADTLAAATTDEDGVPIPAPETPVATVTESTSETPAGDESPSDDTAPSA